MFMPLAIASSDWPKQVAHARAAAVDPASRAKVSAGSK